jgi:gamma-glutamyltranspeptidase/glutathione hydrolase
MGPFIILRPDGRLFAVIGSPGGADIISYNAQALSALIDGNRSIAVAVSRPHVVNLNGATFLEPQPASIWPGISLAARGHAIRFRELRSGLNGIKATGNGLAGATDPRGVGAALGD